MDMGDMTIYVVSGDMVILMDRGGIAILIEKVDMVFLKKVWTWLF